MATPNVLILRAPGTNCDIETAYAFELAGAKAERLHINRLLEQPQLVGRFQILCVPGGFSYGDDVAAGRILGNQIRHHLTQRLGEFKAAGRLILGICNGFQVLVRAGLLTQDDRAEGPAATLTWNDSGKFEDRWVELEAAGRKCVFLEGIEGMYLPVAHAEGKFVTRDAGVLARLETAGQLVLRYRPRNGSPRSGAAPTAYPDNPNGSWGDVAGMCDTTGRVLGLMPHPERHMDPAQHPRWTREAMRREGDGTAIFANAVRYFA